MTTHAFTGSRHGPTEPQRLAFTTWLTTAKPGRLLNGLAIGCDEWALLAAKDYSWELEGFPCNITSQVSTVALELARGEYGGKCHGPMAPLLRNQLMVDLADSLLAMPAGMEEELRSGTWATIRHARKRRKPIVFFWPDGSVTEG